MEAVEDSGMVAMTRLLLSLNKEMGKKRTLEFVKENSNVFQELFYSEKNSNQKVLIDALKSWKEKDIHEIITHLRLTDFQEMIIMAIKNHNNEITLEDLEKEFESQGTSIDTGSVIGGSIAGISKKCERLKIPMIIKISNHGKGSYTYTLVPEVYEHLLVNPIS